MTFVNNHADFDVTPEQTLRPLLALAPSCVIAVTATVDNCPVVMVASSFVGISLDPPLVGFCAQLTSQTWSLIRRADAIGVSVLSELHQHHARAMASKAGDRLAGVETFTGPGGAPFISGATAWFETTLFQETPLGDHVLAALTVRRTQRGGQPPLVFHRGAFERCVPLVSAQ